MHGETYIAYVSSLTVAAGCVTDAMSCDAAATISEVAFTTAGSFKTASAGREGSYGSSREGKMREEEERRVSMESKADEIMSFRRRRVAMDSDMVMRASEMRSAVFGQLVYLIPWGHPQTAVDNHLSWYHVLVVHALAVARSPSRHAQTW